MNFDVLHQISQSVRDIGVIKTKTDRNIRKVIEARKILRLYAGIDSPFSTIDDAIVYYLDCYKTATGRKMPYKQAIKLLQEIYKKESQHEFEHFCK